MLVLGVGDGGLMPSQDHPSQLLGDLRGKILRIDVHSTPGDDWVKYAIPEDNPFVGREGARPEIWAYGLRNPWRFDFDPMTGEPAGGGTFTWTAAVWLAWASPTAGEVAWVPSN